MPFINKSDLPESVIDNLPQHAQVFYREAYISAWEQYRDPDKRRGDASREETAHRIAWSAVTNDYEKDDKSGKWKKKKD
jgi:cation transport regulator